MISIDLTVNRDDLKRIKQRGEQIRKMLVEPDAPVLRYLFKYVADPYARAVMSGMGAFGAESIWDDSDVTGQLSPFLGSVQTVSWRPLSKAYADYKSREGLHLSIWMATGTTIRSVRPVLKTYKHAATLTSGVSPLTNREAYEHAVASEFGGKYRYTDKEGKTHEVKWEGRPLFTLLNEVFKENIDTIRNGVRSAIAETIEKSGWGS